MTIISICFCFIINVFKGNILIVLFNHDKLLPLLAMIFDGLNLFNYIVGHS